MMSGTVRRLCHAGTCLGLIPGMYLPTYLLHVHHIGTCGLQSVRRDPTSQRRSSPDLGGVVGWPIRHVCYLATPHHLPSPRPISCSNLTGYVSCRSHYDQVLYLEQQSTKSCCALSLEACHYHGSLRSARVVWQGWAQKGWWKYFRYVLAVVKHP